MIRVCLVLGFCTTIISQDGGGADPRFTLTITSINAEDNRPAAGIGIRIGELNPPENETPIVLELKTAANGTASFNKLRPGEYSVQVTEAPEGGFAVERQKNVNITANQEFELRLPPGATLTGKVILRGATLKPPILVSVFQRSSGGNALGISRTIHLDQAGGFKVANLNAEKPVEMFVSVEGSLQRGYKSLELRRRQPTDAGEITLEPIDKTQRSIAGRVTLNGQAPAFAGISALSKSPIGGTYVLCLVYAAEDGSYEILGLPPGGYSITVLGVVKNAEIKQVEVKIGETAAVSFEITE
jgi:hypothetical protein